VIRTISLVPPSLAVSGQFQEQPAEIMRLMPQQESRVPGIMWRPGEIMSPAGQILSSIGSTAPCARQIPGILGQIQGMISEIQSTLAENSRVIAQNEATSPKIRARMPETEGMLTQIQQRPGGIEERTDQFTMHSTEVPAFASVVKWLRLGCCEGQRFFAISNVMIPSRTPRH
jgi:hypothetical protein